MLALVGALLLAVPTAGAAGVSSAMTPPFTGGASYSSSESASGCGAHWRLVLGPAFNFTTGHGGSVVATSARSCGGSFAGMGGATSAGSIAVGLDLSVRIGPVTTGPHTVNITWRFQALGDLKLTRGTCSVASTGGGCSEDVAGTVGASAYLVDTTTGATFSPVTSSWAGFDQEVIYDDYCYGTGGGCSTVSGGTTGAFLVASTASWSISATLHHGDRYEVVTVVYVGSYSTVSTYGARLSGASGGAVVDFARWGSGAQLRSVVLS